MKGDAACICGARECEVHRVNCPVWLKDERVRGTQECSDCGHSFNSLTNGRCGVCDYWSRKHEG